MPQAFEVTVYDKTFARRGWVRDYERAAVTVRHNAMSTAEIAVPVSHPAVPKLMLRGSRATVDYDGRQLLSGRVARRSGEGPDPAGLLTFRVDGDFKLLNQVLAWPNPTGGIGQQDQLLAYRTHTGPAETTLKRFAAENITRLGLPVDVAPDQGRGAQVTVQMRMHPLADRLLPAVDRAGVGVTVTQAGGRLVLDCYTPRVRTRELTEASGVLRSWSWSEEEPTATRVVVGGQGEGLARRFHAQVDTPREQAWGLVAESFRDARHVDDAGRLPDEAAAALAEAGSLQGLALTLAETDTFRYGRTVQVGDQVTVAVAPGVRITDVLRAAELVDEAREGLVVTPQLGDGDSAEKHDALIARAIARLAVRYRDLTAGR